MLGQISLLGDFWQAPNLLGGVDWTLRVEILFYLVVGLLAPFTAKLGTGLNSWVLTFLLLAFASATTVLPVLPFGTWNFGYFNIFFPVFFGGIGIALLNLKVLNTLQGILLFSGSFVISKMSELLTRPDLELYAGPYLAIAFVVFLTSYIFRDAFSPTKVVLWLSSLTYSTYLFHNWGFYWVRDSIKQTLELWEFPIDTGMGFSSNLISIILFFAAMTLFVRYFESPINNWARIKTSS
jgi:peptidoglycan/LPS O-acetylase OafA/YrhL